MSPNVGFSDHRSVLFPVEKVVLSPGLKGGMSGELAERIVGVKLTFCVCAQYLLYQQ
jgi:hypothetical protein